MSAASSACAGERRAAAGARGRRSRMSTIAVGGRAGRPAAMSAAAASMESRSLPVGNGGPGVSANGSCVERSAVLGFSFADGDLGRRGRVVAVDAGDGVAARAPVGVVGEAGGRGWLVERKHDLSSSPAATRPSSLPSAAASRALGGSVPVLDDFGSLGDEHVGAVAPFVDGVVQPVEMTPTRTACPRGGGSRGPPRSSRPPSVPVCGRSDRRRRTWPACGPAGRRPRCVAPSSTGCAPSGGTSHSIARLISQSRSLRVDVQS